MSTPLPLRVWLPYATKEEFAARYGHRVSADGIFLSTRSPQPVGTQVQFVLLLANGQLILSGEGRVLSAAESAADSPGMYLQFETLEEDSLRFLSAHFGPTHRIQTSTSEPIIGIDFGSDECRGAVWFNQALRELPSVPACVWLKESLELVVGREAGDGLSRRPDFGLRAPKRFLGVYETPEWKHKLQPWISCPTRMDLQGNWGVVFRQLQFSVVQVSAAILYEFKQQAQKVLGRNIRFAVLSVPHAFTERQRAALWEAANMAGLEVVELLSDNAARALAYAHQHPLSSQNILVADWGSTYFSAALCETRAETVSVVSAFGHSFIGKHDLEALAPLEPNDDVFPNSERPLRHRFLQKALGTLTHVLDAAATKRHAVDAVVLGGAFLQAPWARQTLEHFLGLSPQTQVPSAMEVAFGAALHGHHLASQPSHRTERLLLEVLPSPLGMGTPEGKTLRLFSGNTPLPARRSLTLQASRGRRIHLPFFQGTASRSSENDYLGTATLEPQKTGPLTLHVALTHSGLLKFSASDADSTYESLPFHRAQAPRSNLPQMPSVATTETPLVSLRRG